MKLRPLSILLEKNSMNSWRKLRPVFVKIEATLDKIEATLAEIEATFCKN